jgi:hypothetical protein
MAAAASELLGLEVMHEISKRREAGVGYYSPPASAKLDF